jgi:triosephosphate isomerase
MAYATKFQPAFDFYTTDETTLKTMIRANPGVMVLHHGTILGKWNFRDAPDAAELNPNVLSLILLRQQQFAEIMVVFMLALALSLIYSLVKIVL